MGLLSRVRRDERGISAVIVAVALIGIFGATLLSVDAGNMWQTRRTIIRGTDATALDQAIFAAKTDATDCNRPGANFNSDYSAWTNTLQVNTAGFISGTESCTFTPHPTIAGAGYVQVEANKLANTRFGGLFGIGDTSPYSLSAALIGYPISILGLRPIGLCILNDHYQEWLDLQDGTITRLEYDALRGNPESEHPIYDGAGVVHHITYAKDQPDECGDITNSPGNWGLIDFDGGSNPSSEFADWILNGYDGSVSAPDDCDADGTNPDPGGGAGDQCNGDPGAIGGNDNGGCSLSPGGSTNNVAEAMRCIMSKSGPPPTYIEFPIIVFYDATDCTTGGGGGNNCKYDLARYLFVRLWGFDMGSNGYLDLEFVEGVATGLCCDTTPSQTDVKVVKICAVDHDTSGLTIAQRCEQ